MRARRIMHAVKRCFCRWSTHRERESVIILVRTLLIPSGSQPFRQLKMHNKSLQHKHNLCGGTKKGFDKRTSVTGRHVRPPLLVQRADAAFCEESTE